MLGRIFQDKDKWKKDTFNLIKNELLSVKGNRFVQYDNTNESHLVCVYGKSQVGKTTLILNMIGLKDEVYRKEVSAVLRGGVTKGNSSTATAILYSQSDNNLYGIREESLNDHSYSSGINYYTPEEMMIQLQEIRNEVEKNTMNSHSILHIFIPNDYFSESRQKNIIILDLPGVESRNLHEKAHVESLMNRYIPISSVCIITCPSNTIQSLEHETLPNNIDWKNHPHKFLIVVTKSYSIGSFQSFFLEDRSKREVFKEFIRKRYNSEFENILGPNNIEIFPLEIGDSFEKFIKEGLNNEDDRNEVINTRDSILSSLQESIINHKGELLLSAIKDLHAIVEQSDKERLSSLNSERNSEYEKLAQYSFKVVQSQKLLKLIENAIIESKASIEALKQLNGKIKDIINTYSQELTDNLIKEVRNIINEKNLKKRKDDEDYLVDRDKLIMKQISDYFSTNLKIEEKVHSMLKEQLINIDLYNGSIAQTIYCKFKDHYEKELYSTSLLAEYLFVWFWSSTCNVTVSSALTIIAEIKQIVHEELQTKVMEVCAKKIEQKIAEAQKRDFLLLYRKRKIESLIKSKSEEIEEIGKNITNIEEQIIIAETQKEQDVQTLKTYLKYAKIAYFSQRDFIIEKINSLVNPEEKTLYIFLLGVISKDYQKLIDASNEQYR